MSVAWQVTAVEPWVKVAPGAGEHDTDGAGESALSEAVASG